MIDSCVLQTFRLSFSSSAAQSAPHLHCASIGEGNVASCHAVAFMHVFVSHMILSVTPKSDQRNSRNEFNLLQN